MDFGSNGHNYFHELVVPSSGTLLKPMVQELVIEMVEYKKSHNGLNICNGNGLMP